MKTKKLALILCMTLLCSIFSPAVAFASSPELDVPVDDPVDPAPYSYINQIGIDFCMYTDGSSTDYAEVYVPNRNYHYTLTLELLKMSGGSWDVPATATWTNSGKGTVYIDESYDGLSYGAYCLAATIDVYNASGLKVESVTEYSRTAVFNSDGIIYYW